ncbi:MAG: peptide chain release factor 2 [Alphaproteobacteria bacterium 16-39-46]|nr:MAG: peptide chain release factor 2 [Alphaproteobacteria bacterium 16-39-46]OZA41317.1 MAG: peptide chain release factor 2 [Alphaproteobacteria bacterium 17-39-52]
MFNWEKSTARLKEIETLTLDDKFWDDPHKAQSFMKEKTALETKLEEYNILTQTLEDALTLHELAEESQDDATLLEAESLIASLEKQSRRAQLDSLLSGEADNSAAFLEIHAGAGGTEAQDWTQILLRMYIRWAESRKFKWELIEESSGEEAGLKSATLKITGEKAYGWLKTESGVHRLVRISPFDSNARRHTSFASVWVYPEVDDNITIEIEEKDIRIDTYRASGAGGQHVNKTESAIRITHFPTGIVVQCQSDRSQHRNKATAFKMLKSRIYERELQLKESANKNVEKSEIGWGHQIRSYVLQPYQMVKDLRTNVEVGNAPGVLDGDIDIFLESSLAGRIGE